MSVYPQPPQALIFDLAGVVLTFERDAMIDAMTALCPNPIAARSDVDWILRHPDLRGRGFSFVRLHRLMVDEMQARDNLDAVRDAWGAGFSPMPEMAGLLAKLASQRPLLALSNMPHHGWDGIIRRHPELGHFTHVLLSDDLGLAKPDPAIFRHVIQVAAVPPARCFFVDDTERHVQAARAEGMDSVVFDGVASLRKAIQKRGLTL